MNLSEIEKERLLNILSHAGKVLIPELLRAYIDERTTTTEREKIESILPNSITETFRTIKFKIFTQFEEQ